MVLSLHCRDHQITAVWHPLAHGELLETQHFGAIRVQVGPAKYQLNTGEIVEI